MSNDFSRVFVDLAMANGQATRVFDNLTGTIYVCTAEPGTVATESKWRVCKIVSSATGDPSSVTTWADGNGDADNVATNLAAVAALTYA